MKAPGQPPVDPVTQGGRKKNGNGCEAKILIGVTCSGCLPVIDRKDDKDRDQKDPGDSDLVGKGHTSATFRG